MYNSLQLQGSCLSFYWAGKFARSDCCCLIIPCYSRPCALLRPRRCGLSLVVHHWASLARLGAVLTSLPLFIFLEGICPGARWPLATAEDYNHAADERSWRQRISGRWAPSERAALLNAERDACQLRMEMRWGDQLNDAPLKGRMMHLVK